MHSTYGDSASGGAAPGKRVMRDALLSFPMGPNQALVLNERTRRRCALQRNGLPVLEHCDRFATLHEHAERIADTVPGLGKARGEILKLLEQCWESGLLVSSEALRERIAESPPEGAGSEGWALVVFTCNRPALLERMLDSCRPHLQGDCLPDVALVIDDSRSDQARRENARLVTTWAQASGVRAEIWDRPARASAAETLAAHFPDEAESLGWMLSPHELDEQAISIGQARNLAMLLTAGRRVLMIDDDCVLHPHAAASARPGAALGTPLTGAWPYADWEELEAATTAANLNPLSEHLAVLGAALPSALRRVSDSTPDHAWLHEAEADTAARLSGHCRVRLTMNSVLGDPGTQTMGWLYTRDQASTQRIARFLRGTRRDSHLPQLFWRGRERSMFSFEEAVMTTTLTGLDNRRALPCVLPLGRAEDLTLGIALAALDRQYMSFTFNWALLHQPEPLKRWRRDWLDTPDVLPAPDVVLARVMEEYAAKTALHSEHARRRYLVTALSELSGFGDRELMERVETLLMPEWAARLRNLQDSQLVLNDPGGEFHADVDALKGAIGRTIAQPIQASTGWLTTLRQYARLYASALDTWPAVWAFCRDNRRALGANH